MQDETVMARQLITCHGRNAALQANETALSLKAMGDAESAARWRRIRDHIMELAREDAGGQGMVPKRDA
jgi:hypothetical protein